MNSNKNSLSSILHLLTTGDKILIVTILLIGISSFFLIKLNRQPGSTVTIKVNGQIKHQFSLSEGREISVSGPVGITRIEIKNKGVKVIQSDCPQKICVKTGTIHKSGEIIVCVPNKVVITINGKTSHHFDVITQ